ncbi:MAG: sugar transferase [Eubacteriales bacterium]|nr:sugar transferase [Eubacteriales bacterium]
MDAGRESNLKLTRAQRIYLVIKYILDFVLALMAIVVLCPIYLIIALAIVIDDPGPVIFSQNRIGAHKKIFKLYKFRTMKVSTPHDVPTHLLDHPEQYITRVGRVLRKTSLDELPQFFNILFGQLSLCAPRPALYNQYDLIAERDKCGANDIRPGLTGWAQINGRDELEIVEKAKLDQYYIEHIGFIMDVKCFFGTFLPVLFQEGIVEGSHKEENYVSAEAAVIQESEEIYAAESGNVVVQQQNAG